MAVTATLAQRRAHHAWLAVGRVRDKTEASEYAREAKRLPVQIMTSGLGHAVAFMHAKGKSGSARPKDKSGAARQRLACDLAQWLLEERQLADGHMPADGKALIDAIVKRDSDFLRQATDEALKYLQWLTRFAEAEIGIEEGPSANG